jgi:hypothetical protein
MPRAATPIIACFVAFFAICSCNKTAKKTEPKTPVKPTAPPAPLGVVEGVVELERGATLPSYSPQMMMRQVLAIDKPEAMPQSCSPAKDTDRQPVQLTEEGGLSGVMVAVSGFSRSEDRPPVTHEVVIEDCRLHPMLIVAVKGDLLRLRSDTNYPFMPELGNASITQTILKGEEKVFHLDRGGVQTLLCGFTAACGRTDVVVLSHTLYGITDARGAFRIEKIPAGETVTLNAWHPLFRETNIKLSVQPNEIRRVPLALTPLPDIGSPPKADTSAANAKSRSKAPGHKPRQPAKRNPYELR